MNVGQLIAILQMVDPELMVIFKSTDPSDWTYMRPVIEDHIKVGNAYADEFNDDIPVWDDTEQKEMDYLVIEIDV